MKAIIRNIKLLKYYNIILNLFLTLKAVLLPRFIKITKRKWQQIEHLP